MRSKSSVRLGNDGSTAGYNLNAGPLTPLPEERWMGLGSSVAAAAPSIGGVTARRLRANIIDRRVVAACA